MITSAIILSIFGMLMAFGIVLWISMYYCDNDARSIRELNKYDWQTIITLTIMFPISLPILLFMLAVIFIFWRKKNE